MGRFKVKESHPITLRMDQELYDKLDEFCIESGQTKTVAVERAVKQYIDSYENEQEIIRKAKKD